MRTVEECFFELLTKESGAELLSLALTPKHAGGQNNERLEFLGKAVLRLRTAESLYQDGRRFPPATMYLMCEYLTSSPVLVMAGREGGLAATLASHGAKEGGKVTDKMVSSAFEAMVGALYEKESYQAAVRLIDNFLLVDEYVSGSFNGKGAITELKELGDRDREMKVTHSTSERIEDGVTIYSHVTTVNGKASKGEGRTKKGAEARAAARALADVLPYVPK